MKQDTEQEIIIKPEKKLVEYNVRIGNHLFQRIKDHLHVMQRLKNGESKQRWIQEAIEEKLASEDCSEQNKKDRYLHLKVNVNLWKALEEKVESLKKTRLSVSKKEFIQEAIFEKLDREEHTSKELFKKMLQTHFQDQKS